MSWYNGSGAPVPLFADAGQTVSLRSLLEQAYGAEAVSEFGTIRLFYRNAPGYANFSYWDPNNPSSTQILQNGTTLNAEQSYAISGAQELDAITLRAGNLIYANVYIAIQTSAADDTYQELELKTVPTRFRDAGDFDGVTSASDVVASARALAAAYNGVANFNDCHYIAGTIAAASGASFPTHSGDMNPGRNEEAGFWRVIHRGSQNAYANWQLFVQPGDIVRLQWASGGPHTFTVTSGLNAAGQIQVVDNGNNQISEHWVDYDGAVSRPESITIYRLAADGLNVINDSPFNDLVHGTVWNDLFRSDYGVDFQSSSGVDTFKGGLGDDTYEIGSAPFSTGDSMFFYDNVVEKAGEGTDTVVVGREVSFIGIDEASYYTAYRLGANIENGRVSGTNAFDLYGNELDNTITGNGAANLLDGDFGDDRLDGGAGADTLLGGAGSDGLYGQGDDDLLRGGADNDRLHGGFSIENDSRGSDGNDTLYGEGGDDILVVSYGRDSLDGGTGSDTLSFDWMDSNLTINLGAGAATFSESGAIPPAGPGTWGSGWTSTVNVTWTNMENLTGGIGSDSLTGDNNANVIEGRSGNDALFGLDGDDVLSGGQVYRSFRLSGSDGDDSLSGGAGDDTLMVSFGHDTLDGGSGRDTLSFGWVSTALDVDLSAGSETFTTRAFSYATWQYVPVTVTVDWSSMENLTGGSAADTLRGSDGSNRLDGGAGADTLRGGKGNDTYVVDNAGDRVIEDALQGRDLVLSSVSFGLSGQYLEDLTLTGTNSISATGNSLDNVLTGNAGHNRLTGGTGADLMKGGRGNDTYVVDDAGDRVIEYADQGRDRVISSVSFDLSGQHIEELTLTGTGRISGTGNSLDNLISGNDAANLLTGGGGADTFVFNRQLGGGNVDRIADFVASTARVHDTIQLARSIFTELDAGRLATAAFKDVTGGRALDASDRILYDRSTGFLAYDADGSGSGAAVRFATLDNKAALTAADFRVA